MYSTVFPRLGTFNIILLHLININPNPIQKHPTNIVTKIPKAMEDLIMKFALVIFPLPLLPSSQQGVVSKRTFESCETIRSIKTHKEKKVV